MQEGTECTGFLDHLASWLEIPERNGWLKTGKGVNGVNEKELDKKV